MFKNRKMKSIEDFDKRSEMISMASLTLILPYISGRKTMKEAIADLDNLFIDDIPEGFSEQVSFLSDKIEILANLLCLKELKKEENKKDGIVILNEIRNIIDEIENQFNK